MTKGECDNSDFSCQQKCDMPAMDILLRSVLGGMLILVPGLLGYVAGNLWLFPSLGPTVFQQVMSPHQRSSRFYNVLVGHLIGLFCGYALVIISGNTFAMSAIESGHLSLSQVMASCVAISLIILLQTPFKAIHPPAASTALLIVLGGFKATWHDFSMILIGIVIIAISGEIVRHILLLTKNDRRGIQNKNQRQQ